MSLTIKITGMAKLAKNPDNIDNVIIGANYEISKTVNNHTAKIEGHASLNAFDIDANAFVAYDQITEENVIEWVKKSIGDRLASIEIYLDEELARDFSVAQVAVMPWNS
jgi:hypothetical protein